MSDTRPDAAPAQFSDLFDAMDTCIERVLTLRDQWASGDDVTSELHDLLGQMGAFAGLMAAAHDAETEESRRALGAIPEDFMEGPR